MFSVLPPKVSTMIDDGRIVEALRTQFAEQQRQMAEERAARKPPRAPVREGLKPSDPKDATESPNDYFDRIAEVEDDQ
jgi:hypothetical protein